MHMCRRYKRQLTISFTHHRHSRTCTLHGEQHGRSTKQMLLGRNQERGVRVTLQGEPQTQFRVRIHAVIQALSEDPNCSCPRGHAAHAYLQNSWDF